MNEQEKTLLQLIKQKIYDDDGTASRISVTIHHAQSVVKMIEDRDAEVSALRDKIKAISELSDQLLDNASDPGYDDGQQAAYRNASELIHAILTK